MQEWKLDLCLQDEGNTGFIPNGQLAGKGLVRYGTINTLANLQHASGPELAPSDRQRFRGTNDEDECAQVIPSCFFGSASNVNNFILLNKSLNNVSRYSAEEELFNIITSEDYAKSNARLDFIWITWLDEIRFSYPDYEQENEETAIRPSSVLHLIQFTANNKTHTYGCYYFNPTKEEVEIAEKVLRMVTAKIPKTLLFQYPIKLMGTSLQNSIQRLCKELNSRKAIHETVTKIWRQFRNQDLDDLCGEHFATWQDNLIDKLCENFPIERKTSDSMAKLVFRSGFSIGHFLVYLYDQYLLTRVPVNAEGFFHLSPTIRGAFFPISMEHFKAKTTAVSYRRNQRIHIENKNATVPLVDQHAKPLIEKNVSSGAYELMCQSLQNKLVTDEPDTDYVL